MTCFVSASLFTSIQNLCEQRNLGRDCASSNAPLLTHAYECEFSLFLKSKTYWPKRDKRNNLTATSSDYEQQGNRAASHRRGPVIEKAIDGAPTKRHLNGVSLADRC